MSDTKLRTLERASALEGPYQDQKQGVLFVSDPAAPRELAATPAPATSATAPTGSDDGYEGCPPLTVGPAGKPGILYRALGETATRPHA